jgi:hypothetical protein
MVNFVLTRESQKRSPLVPESDDLAAEAQPLRHAAGLEEQTLTRKLQI